MDNPRKTTPTLPSGLPTVPFAPPHQEIRNPALATPPATPAVPPPPSALHPVHKAAHYNTGRFEVIDVLSDWGLEHDALLWNTVKYIARCEHKGQKLQDLQKARYYLDRRIRQLEAEQDGPEAPTPEAP